MAEKKSLSGKPRIRKAVPAKQPAKAADGLKKRGVKARLRIRLPLPSRQIVRNPLIRIFARVFRPLGKILKFLVPRYFINSWREVRQITWPNRRETWRLTGAVFIFAIVFGALIAVVDKGLDELFKKLILR